jgi:hypothetical protein
MPLPKPHADSTTTATTTDASTKPSVDELRQSIKAKSIIHRLTMNALAPEELMTASQVNAAKVLLNKLIPDLKAVEFSGLPNGGLPTAIEINITQPSQPQPQPKAIEHDPQQPSTLTIDIPDSVTPDDPT